MTITDIKRLRAIQGILNELAEVDSRLAEIRKMAARINTEHTGGKMTFSLSKSNSSDGCIEYNHRDPFESILGGLNFITMGGTNAIETQMNDVESLIILGALLNFYREKRSLILQKIKQYEARA